MIIDPHGNQRRAAELLLHICSGTADEREVTQLANLCIDVAVCFLKYLESTGRRIRETDDPAEFSRIAADGVAELFARDAQGHYLIWRRVFAGLVANQSPEHEWLRLLRRLVIRRMQQRLLLLYQQRDPESARLLRNIRLSAKRLPNVRLVRDMLGLALEYNPRNRPSGNHFVRPPLPLLRAIVTQSFRPDFTIDQLIAALLERLSSLLDPPLLFRVEDLAALIRECRRDAQETPQEEETLQMLDDKALRFCMQAARHSLAVVEKKLYQQYVRKGKVTLTEAAALIDVLSRTLFSRLECEDEPLTTLSAALANRPEFCGQVRDKLRPVVDYLLKIYRREMKQRVGDLLN